MKSALAHPLGVTKSDHAIAKHCGVDVKTVSSWRNKAASSMEIPQMDTRTVTRNGTTYQQNTANIGKSAPKTMRQLVDHIVGKEMGSRGLQVPPTPAEACRQAIATGKPVAAINNTFVLPMTERLSVQNPVRRRPQGNGLGRA